MGYPEKLLNPGERVAVDVVPHWKYLALPAVSVAIVLAGAIVALQSQLPRWADLAIAGVMVAVPAMAGPTLPPLGDDFVCGDQSEADHAKRRLPALRARDPHRPFDGHHLQTDPDGPAAT